MPRRARSRWHTFPERRAASERAGRLRGIGCSLFQEPSGAGAAPKDEVAVMFTSDGSVKLYMAAQSSGQGHETVFSELVALWLGLDRDQVELRAGDPDGPKVIGSGAFGSRTQYGPEQCVQTRHRRSGTRPLPIAADMMEVDTADVEFRDGRYTIKGTDRSIAMTTLVERLRDRSPHPLDTVSLSSRSFAHFQAVHVAEVEIDPETGAVQVSWATLQWTTSARC